MDLKRAAIIAGGRDYHLGPVHFEWLCQKHRELQFGTVLTGCAPGADAGGECWAQNMGLLILRFPADWNSYGLAAGPMRNKAMAIQAAPDGYCLLFPGGRGTASMRSLAGLHGLKIFEYEKSLFR